MFFYIVAFAVIFPTLAAVADLLEVITWRYW